MRHRLFVAIDMPEAIKADIQRLRGSLGDARFTDPGQLHLTLRFIGEVETDKKEAIQEALQRVRCVGFPLRLQGIGYFPQPRRQRVCSVSA